MRIDRATISLQPRNVFQCLDVGLCFYGQHVGSILKLWLWVVVPAGCLTYELVTYSDFDLRIAVFIAWFAMLPLGGLLMSAAVPHAFGDPFDPAERESFKADPAHQTTISVLNTAIGLAGGVLLLFYLDAEFLLPWARRETIRLSVLGVLTGLFAFRGVVFLDQLGRLHARLFQTVTLEILRKTLVAVGPAICVFAGGWWIALGLPLAILSCPFLVRSGFRLEHHFLRHLDRKLHSREIGDLLKNETAELFFRGGMIAAVCGLFTVVLFWTFDAWSWVVFRFPILAGRMGRSFTGEGVFEDLLYLFTADARVLVLLVGIVLLVYPLARLAWFFCYLDLRIRQDCWDIELRFVHEAERLEGAA